MRSQSRDAVSPATESHSVLRGWLLVSRMRVTTSSGDDTVWARRMDQISSSQRSAPAAQSRTIADATHRAPAIQNAVEIACLWGVPFTAGSLPRSRTASVLPGEGAVSSDALPLGVFHRSGKEVPCRPG